MLHIKNIEKLKGEMIDNRNWICYEVKTFPELYRLIFKPNQRHLCFVTMDIIKQPVFLQATTSSPETYPVKLSIDDYGKPGISNLISIKSKNGFIEKVNLTSKDKFVSWLGHCLYQCSYDINEYREKQNSFAPYYPTSGTMGLQPSLNPFHTASLNTAIGITKNSNYGSGAQSIGVQKNRYGGQTKPQWYVSEEKLPELKKPTMWETFKEMVKWDKWVDIFPIIGLSHIFSKKEKDNR